jgi:hypothetical protein
MLEKRIVLLFWVCLIGQMLVAQDLYRVQENGRFGYIDEKGKKVIPFIYVNAGEFRDGLAPVRLPKGLFGYINENGEWAIKPQYDYAREFSEGLAVVFEKDKPLVININGKIVIKEIDIESQGQAKLLDIEDFKNGVSHAKFLETVYYEYSEKEYYENKQVYLINKEGEIICPNEYLNPSPYNYYIKDKGIIYDKKGYTLFKPSKTVHQNSELKLESDTIFSFLNKFATYNDESKQWIDSLFWINHRGEIISKKEFVSEDYDQFISKLYLNNFYEVRKAIIRNQGKYLHLLINLKGDTIFQDKEIFKIIEYKRSLILVKDFTNDGRIRAILFDENGTKISNDILIDRSLVEPSFLENTDFYNQDTTKSLFRRKNDRNDTEFVNHLNKVVYVEAQNYQFRNSSDSLDDTKIMLSEVEGNGLYKDNTKLKGIPIYKDSVYFYVNSKETDSTKLNYFGYIVNNKTKNVSFELKDLPIIQALNKDNKWISITDNINWWCGNTEFPDIVIESNSALGFKIPIYRGNYKTKLRLIFYNRGISSLISNPFDATINYAQLLDIQRLNYIKQE